MKQYFKVKDRRLIYLGSNPSSATNELCDLRKLF